jgi:hypothetical protein
MSDRAQTQWRIMIKHETFQSLINLFPQKLSGNFRTYHFAVTFELMYRNLLNFSGNIFVNLDFQNINCNILILIFKIKIYIFFYLFQCLKFRGPWWQGPTTSSRRLVPSQYVRPWKICFDKNKLMFLKKYSYCIWLACECCVLGHYIHYELN